MSLKAQEEYCCCNYIVVIYVFIVLQQHTTSLNVHPKMLQDILQLLEADHYVCILLVCWWN